MPKVVIDTNVLISALIQRSYPYLIINNLLIEGKVELCISDEVFGEYYEVLNRKKFAKYRDFISQAETLLSLIETNATRFIPSIKLNVIKDLDDNKFLELAVKSKAKFLITGNTSDFTMPVYKQTKL